MLKHRKHDVLVFHILTKTEVGFRLPARPALKGWRRLPDSCGPRALRAGYVEGARRIPDGGPPRCSASGIRYTLVRTGDYLDAMLAKF